MYTELLRRNEFLLKSDAVVAFESLREKLLSVCLKCIENEPFTVECNASDFAIAAVLGQGERLLAFVSRALSKNWVLTTPKLKRKLLRI